MKLVSEQYTERLHYVLAIAVDGGMQTSSPKHIMTLLLRQETLHSLPYDLIWPENDFPEIKNVTLEPRCITKV